MEELTAYCKCNETLTWHQLVNGSWPDISGQFTAITDQTWTFQPTQAQIDEGTIYIRYCCDSKCSNTSQVNFGVSQGNPSIALNKIASPTSINPANVGDIITYTFTVVNTGTIDLTNVTITDPLFTVSGGPINLPIGATDTNTFTGSYQITQTDIDNGSVLNMATVNAQSTNGPASDISNVTVTLNGAIACSPTLTLPDKYNPPEPPCTVDTEPIAWSGTEGQIIDLQAGSCTSCDGVWQKFDDSTGLWVDSTNPSGQAAVKGVHDGQWRICCDPGVSYSTPVLITVNCLQDIPVFNTQPPYSINVNLGEQIPDQGFGCCNGGDYFPQYWDDSDPLSTGWKPTGANNFPSTATCQWTYTFNGNTTTIDLDGSQWRICCPDGCSDDNTLSNAITINIAGCP